MEVLRTHRCDAFRALPRLVPAASGMNMSDVERRTTGILILPNTDERSTRGMGTGASAKSDDGHWHAWLNWRPGRGGEWISSIDMENSLTSLPGVSVAAVVGVPHPRWDERPVAVVTLHPGASKDNLLERAREHLSKAFAKFQLPDDVLDALVAQYAAGAVPAKKSVLPVWDAIPLSSTGKIDKKVIRARLEAGTQEVRLASFDISLVADVHQISVE
eukprot:s596_g9.t1